MKIIKRIFKYIFQFFTALTHIDFWRVYDSYDKNSKVVIVFNLLRGNIGIELFCWDLAAVQYCALHNIPFSISSGRKKSTLKLILWSPSKQFVKKSINYPDKLIEYAKQKEDEGNLIYPSSIEVSYLENKKFMHEKFEELGVRTPRTLIYHSVSEIDPSILQFPLLLKGAHSSGSLDVHKINSFNELISFLRKSDFIKIHECIILQELLPIRSDLRVTFIHDEIVLNYWRINPSKEWKPTSTSHGNNVDFENFPELWREFIVNEFRKLQITMGAFDVAWENDDLSQIPYILEFSPRFTPNPPFKHTLKNNQYGLRKRELFGKDVYYRNQVELIFQFNFKYLSKFI